MPAFLIRRRVPHSSICEWRIFRYHFRAAIRSADAGELALVSLTLDLRPNRIIRDFLQLLAGSLMHS